MSIRDIKRQLSFSAMGYDCFCVWVSDRLPCLDTMQKILCEITIEELKKQLDRKKIMVSKVPEAIGNFKELMRSDERVVRKFIQKYVEKVIAYQDCIEIILLANKNIR